MSQSFFYFNAVILASILVTVGCSNRTEASEWASFDAGPPHICSTDTWLSDFWNCGSCDNLCSVDISDRCSGGVCVCGPYTSSPCDETSECRFGTCIALNPGGRVCEFDPECSAGFACIRGHCTQTHCVPEVCDGLDNDCNGIVDDSPSRGPLSRWCWEDDMPVDPREPGLSPPCRRGTQICEAGGTWSHCAGGVRPQEEIGLLACDGIDNNCDGCPDGTITKNGVCMVQSSPGMDIVYAMDISGSMVDKVRAVAYATEAFSADFAGTSARFGLFIFPGRFDGSIVKITDLVDYTTFSRTLSALVPTLIWSGSMEPSYDLVYALGSGEIPMSWRPGSTRIIILFTDEEGQSFGMFPLDSRRPRLVVNEAIMCAALTHGEVLATLTLPAFAADFDECGMIFTVSPNRDEMLRQLRTIITEPCH